MRWRPDIEESPEHELLGSSYSGQVKTVFKKLDAGVNPNCINGEGSTPLHLASSKGHTLIVKNLIKFGGDTNYPGPSEWTPLHVACFFGHVETVRVLLKNGADAHAENEDGKVPGQEFSEAVPYLTCLQILTLLKLAATEEDDLEEVLGGSISSEDFAETLFERNEYKSVLSAGIVPSQTAHAPRFQVADETLALEHFVLPKETDDSEHPINQLWNSQVAKDNRPGSLKTRMKSLRKAYEPFPKHKSPRNQQKTQEQNDISSQPAAKLSFFGLHIEESAQMNSARSDKYLLEARAGTLKGDRPHSLYSQAFGTDRGIRSYALTKQAQNSNAYSLEQKNEFGDEKYKNDDHLQTEMCSPKVMDKEFARNQKILFKRMLKATFLFWKREGKDVADYFSKQCSTPNTNLLTPSEFEAACKELGCPLCKKQGCDDWPRLADGDFQLLCEIFDTTGSGHISLERLKLFIDASKDTESKGFGIEPMPDQLAPLSIFALDFHHPVRQFFLEITFNPVFQRFILLIILANAITIAIVDYSVVNASGTPVAQGWNYNIVDSNGNPLPAFSVRNLIMRETEPIFTAIFTFESIVRIIALGFVNNKNSYLRSGWNCLDFFVVVTSLISFLPGASKLRILKLFRVLRPLKALSRLEGLRIIIQALIYSLKGLGSALIIFCFFLFLFIAVGIDIFSGAFYARCRLTPFPVLLNSSCLSAYDSCWSEYINEVTAYPDAWRCLEAPNDDASWTKLGSPWSTPQDCIWPIAPENHFDRICSLTGTGVYQCPTNTTCGSAYDNSGNPRFISSAVPFGIDRMVMDTFDNDFDNSFVTFDNFGAAFISIFQMITMTDAYEVMNMGSDSVGAAPSACFWVLSIFIGNWILVNLLLGVLTDGLQEEHGRSLQQAIDIWDEAEETGQASAHVSSQQETALENEITSVSLQDSKSEVKQCNSWRSNIAVFVDGVFFSAFMMTCIVMNTIILSLDHYPETLGFVDKLQLINYVLTIVFALEMLLMWAAHGVREYFRSSANIFDGVIVFSGMTELVLDLDGSSGNPAITVLRTFRMFRLFKLAKKSKDIQALVKHMVSTFLEMGNFALLLCLFIYMFALIGMQLFANTLHFDPTTGAPVNLGDPGFASASVPLLNFDTFFMAFVTVYCALTFENWDSIYWNCRLATSNLTASMYFLVMLGFGAFVLMNVFVGILLTNFGSHSEETSEGEERRRSTIKEDAVQETGMMNRTFKKVTVICQNSAFFQNISAALAVVRKPFAPVAKHSSFEATVLLVVIFSSFTLCLESPLNDPNGIIQHSLDSLDVFFAVFFSGEAFVKICGLGPMYFSDRWNQLDFVVTAFSVIAMCPLGSTTQAFGMARVFRPIRLVNKVATLKQVVIVIFKSLPTMANVLVLILLVFLVYSIFSVAFLKGAFYQCTGSMTADQLNLLTYPVPWIELTNEQISWFNGTRCSDSDSYPKQPTSHAICDCWFDTAWTPVLQFPLNFNNVLSGLCTYFEISTTSGWEDVMLTAASQRGIDFQPVPCCNLAWIVFFIIFMLIGFLFLVNAFIGAIVDFFNRERKADGQGSTFATQAQREWVEITYLITKMTAQRNIPKPKSLLPRLAFDLVVPKKDPVGPGALSKFEMCSLSVICLNGMVLAMSYFGQPDNYASGLANINVACGVFFNVEAVLKIVATHIFYFADPWNILDFTVVVCTDTAYIVVFATGKELHFLGTFARVLRLLRLFQVITRVQGVKLLFEDLLESLPGFINIAFLLVLVMFIYAVAGVQLFSKLPTDSYVTAHQNFRSFQNAMLVLFRIASGDNWNYFVHSMETPNDGCESNPSYNPDWCELNNNAPNCVPLNGCGNGYLSLPFFYTYFLLVSHILVNLFIGVILDGMQNEGEKLNFSVIPREAIRDYNDVWDKVDPLRQNHIPVYLFPQFLKMLNEPFGLEEEKRCDLQAIGAFIERLEVPRSSKNSIDGFTYRAITEALAKEVLKKVHGDVELDAASPKESTTSFKIKFQRMLSKRRGFRLNL